MAETVQLTSPSLGDQNEEQSKTSLGRAKNGQLKPQAKGKRKTRAQRRKEKNQRLKLELQQQTGVEPKQYDDRVIVKDNPNLVRFYKLQPIIEESEFDIFMEGLRTTLPASFRINTFDYGQAKFLRQLVQGEEFHEFLRSAGGTTQNETNPTKINSPVLEPLPWYPKQLAWQMNVTRNDLKKCPILQKLHRFIMAETDNGFISRQESVSMIPPLVLDIHRGQSILDMCAAPGSKTAQLLEYLKFDIRGEEEHEQINLDNGAPAFDDGLVVANDVDNKRCYMLVHQSNRLNSPNCVIINEDASRLPNMKTFFNDGDEYSELKFDRILCDAPCSGDGTVRKNPDVWRKWTTGNANNFHGLQSKILKRGVELLKANGLIVYSTCSMNPVEDEAVVASILRMCQGRVVLEDCSQRLAGLKYRPGVTNWVVVNRDMEVVKSPDEVKPEQASQIHTSLFPPNEDEVKEFNLHRCVRMLPHIQNTGAFFVAVLRKLTPTLPWEDPASMDTDTQQPAVEGQVDNSGELRAKKNKQANPKRKRYGGFREDPFVFMDSNDPDWYKIRDFYGLSENFPAKQLMHRCQSGKKRSIHLVSKSTRSFMMANCEETNRTDFVKLINGGMRLFAKAETEAGFRICQDGVNEIVPHVKSDLKVPITRDDLKALLDRKTVPMEELSSGVHLKERLKPGSCILIYKHQSEVYHQPIETPLVAWRGERSMALYVSRTYRVHLSALIQLKIGSINVDNGDVQTQASSNSDQEEKQHQSVIDD